MAMQRIKLKDVAQAAGVSRTTVSFVLNGRDSTISEETRQRVLEACKRLGYQPDANARALATGKTMRIGIALGLAGYFNLENYYYNDILRGAISGAMERDYNVLFHSGQIDNSTQLYDDITSGATDGVLLVGCWLNDCLALKLMEIKFPTVCISGEVHHERAITVDCNDADGAFQATSHLLDLGHKHIAFFYQNDNSSWNRARLTGIRQALCEHGLSDDHLVTMQWDDDDPRKMPFLDRAIECLKETTPRLTALIQSDEEPVRMLMESLPAHGIQVPKDLSVISFNSTEISKRSHPPMTSVYQPLRRIGKCAADTLIDLAEEKPIESKHISFPVKLQVRNSCAPPNDALLFSQYSAVRTGHSE
jgi:DNA-binding LacI/PurR family transcriptional regulator